MSPHTLEQLPMKANDVRKGHVIIWEGKPCRVMDFQHRTPGNLRAFVQIRFRDLISGNTFDQRVSATDFLDEARLETKELQVMYQDGDAVHVMDGATYEQYSLDNETVGDLKQWLQPEVVVQADWLDGRPIGLRLPKTMELEIVDTAPIMKTATKTASTKPATLSNGVVVQVPEFLSNGERVRVDPNTGEYMDRAK
ncbi:MAG TPA: elongation factor P [Gemmatimonadales bacterium]|nr:elongation factor P [Gemmatimonadales bacterium]